VQIERFDAPPHIIVGGDLRLLGEAALQVLDLALKVPAAFVHRGKCQRLVGILNVSTNQFHRRHQRWRRRMCCRRRLG
jgi:hypothetical protein